MRAKRPVFAPLEDEFHEVDDLDDGEEASEDQLQRWNDDDAFQRFLTREAARECAMRRSNEPQTPAPASSRPKSLILGRSPPRGSPSHPRTRASQSSHPYTYTYAHASSSSSSVSLAPSSPSTLPILFPSSDFDGDAEAWSDVDFDPDTDANPSSEASTGAESDTQVPRGRATAPVYQIELPMQTPFPASAGVRRRVARHYKRIERQTSRGLSELSDSDEEPVTVKVKHEEPPARAAEEEEEEEEEERDELESSQESEERTAKRPVPVIAAQGPDVFARGGDWYDEEWEGRRPAEEDSDDDDFWEDGPTVAFVPCDIDADDDWDDDL